MLFEDAKKQHFRSVNNSKYLLKAMDDVKNIEMYAVNSCNGHVDKAPAIWLPYTFSVSDSHSRLETSKMFARDIRTFCHHQFITRF